MSRRTLLAGVPIVLLWVVMTALLARREGLLAGDAASSPGTAVQATEPTDTWLALYAGPPDGGNRVGYVHLQQLAERRGDRDGVTVRLAVALHTQILGRDTGLEIGGWGWRDLLGDGGAFDFQVGAGDSDFRIRGDVADERLRAVVESAGEQIPLELPVPGDFSFADALGGALTLPDLEVGERATLAAFDPVTLSVGRAEVRCVAREVLLVSGESLHTRVFEVIASGLQSRAWVDDRGEVVQAETPVGLSVRRVSAAEALQPARGELASGNDLLALTAVVPRGLRPSRGASGMVVRLGGAPLAGALPVDDTQRRLPDTPGETGARYEISAASDGQGGREGGSARRAPAARDLASDAFVQASHPRLREASASILADVASDAPWARALALHAWVFESVEKAPTLSIPSALDVLEQRRGDCNEHTVLYAALARAAGIPTRVAIGVVWSDELEGFYYHAWPEVFVDGTWRWTDPTLGQEIADATHIKLLEGGVETWPQLLPFLGKLEVHVERVW
jgi:hypothetical protein